MIVQHADLADGTRVLQLEDGLLFHAQYDDVTTTDANLWFFHKEISERVTGQDGWLAHENHVPCFFGQTRFICSG